MVLAKGEFDVSSGDGDVEVWVTQMGPWANMNTAFVDRKNSIVAIIDPYDGKGWLKALNGENLEPTHILLTHTHKDHTAGVNTIRKVHPEIEIWGHEESVSPSLLGRIIFRRTDFTHTWNQAPDEEIDWTCGSIHLKVIHSPGHSPGHVTMHGHGVYVAGDLLFTMRSGRVDLPGSDPDAQWRSLARAKSVLQTLPSTWRLIPGHRYDWIDGSTPDWVTIQQALKHNISLNAPNIEIFDSLPYNRFDDDLSA
jgi:glyoxylase-like metal-dependent hydrolase (beta-lactamase superfamily II)